MSVELSQAELVRQWFTPIPDGAAAAEGADAADRLSMKSDIQRVSQLLSKLWFSADYAWTQWSDGDVLAVLQQWLPPGTSDEAEFGRYATAGQLASFIGWLDRAIPRWQGEEAQATAERGIENPDYARNAITGTHFYRWAADRGEYLYSDEQDAPYVPGGTAWRSIDDRVAAQDPAQPHYDPGTDRWRRPAAGGIYEYQHRDDLVWERTDGASWLRKHSDAAGWLPYDKNSDTWFHDGRWRAHQEVAAAPAPAAPGPGPGPGPASRVIPVHQIPGWERLEGEPWAAGWYALPGADHYTYLHSPGAVPTEDTPGWTDVPPAPPLDYAGEAGAAEAGAGGREAEQDPQLSQTREQAQQLIIEPVMATLRRDQPDLFEEYTTEDIEAMVWEQLGQLT